MGRRRMGYLTRDHSHPRTSRDYDACGVCGDPLPSARAADVCQFCENQRAKAAKRRAAKVPAPIVVRYIAGYVPPKGSIAMALLNRVHMPIRGLGL